MCRLALINREGVEELESRGGLLALLDYLEQMQGGHGNGYALIKNGRCIDLDKGICLSNSEICQRIANSKYDWLIWHTRLASCGKISNSNCHPFMNRKTGDILASNGTEWDITEYNRRHNIDKTDTEMLLMNWLPNDNFKEALRKNSSVLIGAHKGKVFAVRNNGQLKMLMGVRGGGVVLASDIPDYFGKSVGCSAYFEAGFPEDPNSKYHYYKKAKAH